MEPARQNISIKPLSVCIRVLGVLIWAPSILLLVWRDVRYGSETVPIMATFAAATAVCVVLLLGYLFLPNWRGPYGTRLAGAAIGGLIAILLAIPVFAPLLRIQLGLTEKMMRAMNFPLIGQWVNILFLYGACIEIVLIGMAGGWIFVVVHSGLKAKRLRVDGC